MSNKNPRRKGYYLRDKFVILCRYGKKCVCCGESSHHFLTLDHINNDGNIHRKEIGRSTDKLHSWIKKNDFPSDIQLLCWNCNWGKKKWGECPHTLFKNKRSNLGDSAR